MCAAHPFGQFLKFLQIDVFPLVFDLLPVVFVAEMPDGEGDRRGNDQNNKIPKPCGFFQKLRETNLKKDKQNDENNKGCYSCPKDFPCISEFRPFFGQFFSFPDNKNNQTTRQYAYYLMVSKPNSDLLPSVIRISHCSSFRQSASSFSMPLLPETSRCLHKPPRHRQCAAYPHKISVSPKPAERQSAVSISFFQTAFPFQAV